MPFRMPGGRGGGGWGCAKPHLLCYVYTHNCGRQLHSLLPAGGVSVLQQQQRGGGVAVVPQLRPMCAETTNLRLGFCQSGPGSLMVQLPTCSTRVTHCSSSSTLANRIGPLCSGPALCSTPPRPIVSHRSPLSTVVQRLHLTWPRQLSNEQQPSAALGPLS